jgi:hypothetical protein
VKHRLRIQMKCMSSFGDGGCGIGYNSSYLLLLREQAFFSSFIYSKSSEKSKKSKTNINETDERIVNKNATLQPNSELTQNSNSNSNSNSTQTSQLNQKLSLHHSDSHSRTTASPESTSTKSPSTEPSSTPESSSTESSSTESSSTESSSTESSSTWYSIWDETQQLYYYWNPSTQQTQWELPDHLLPEKNDQKKTINQNSFMVEDEATLQKSSSPELESTSQSTESIFFCFFLCFIILINSFILSIVSKNSKQLSLKLKSHERERPHSFMPKYF